MAKSFEEEQLPISIQGHFLDQLILIGVAVVNGAADGESVGRPALRLVSRCAGDRRLEVSAKLFTTQRARIKPLRAYPHPAEES